MIKMKLSDFGILPIAWFSFVLACILLAIPPGNSGAALAQQTYGAEAESTQSRTGYFLQSGTDILLSAGSGSHTTARIFFVNGHRFTPRTSVGIGLGFTPYGDPLSLIPFFFDYSHRFFTEGITPALFARAGYNFSVKSDDSVIMDNHSGGFLLHLGAGLEFPLSTGLDLYLNAGYSIDNSNYQFDSWGDMVVTNDLSFRRLALGFGFKITP